MKTKIFDIEQANREDMLLEGTMQEVLGCTWKEFWNNLKEADICGDIHFTLEDIDKEYLFLTEDGEAFFLKNGDIIQAANWEEECRIWKVKDAEWTQLYRSLRF